MSRINKFAESAPGPDDPGSSSGRPPPLREPRSRGPGGSKRERWHRVTFGIVVALVGVITLTGIYGCEESTDESDENPAAVEAEPTPEAEPEPTPAEPEHETFGDGDFAVPGDVKPGTYRTREGSSGCYYAVLKDFSGDLDAIIANNNTDAPAIVTIPASAGGFSSLGCGEWTDDLSRITASKTNFEDGAYFVGKDIAPGTYRSSGEAGCYFARVSGFDGSLESIIANENADTPAIVQIASTDEGFISQGCGTWTKSG